ETGRHGEHERDEQTRSQQSGARRQACAYDVLQPVRMWAIHRVMVIWAIGGHVGRLRHLASTPLVAARPAHMAADRSITDDSIRSQGISCYAPGGKTANSLAEATGSCGNILCAGASSASSTPKRQR